MTLIASTSTATLLRLAASLPNVRSPRLTSEIIDRITDAAEEILSPGPVGGFASWSAKARPEDTDTDDLLALVPPMQQWLVLLVDEALTWDPISAAEPIARATALGCLDTPTAVGAIRGRLRQMATAAIDLLEALVPVVDECPWSPWSAGPPPPVGMAGHGLPLLPPMREDSHVQAHSALPAR